MERCSNLFSIALVKKNPGQSIRFMLFISYPEPLLLHKARVGGTQIILLIGSKQLGSLVSVLLYLVLVKKHHSKYKNLCVLEQLVFFSFY